MIKVTIGDDTHEVGLDQIETGDDVSIITPDNNDGWVRQEIVNGLEKDWKTKYRELQSEKESLETDEHFHNQLKEKGFQFNDEGLVVPLDDTEAKDARRKMYERWEDEYKKKNLDPVLDENEQLKSKVSRYRNVEFERDLMNAARDVVKDEYLKPVGNGKPAIFHMVRDNFDYYKTEENEGWFVKDGDTYRDIEGKPMTVDDFVSELTNKDEYKYLIKDNRRRSSNSQPASKSKITGFSSVEELNKAAADMTDAEFNTAYAALKEQLNNN